MQKIVITKEDKGRRLDKYLTGLLPAAGFGFLQKMMRKKSITVNGKKAHGSYSLREGDVIDIFFSDETFNSFKDADKGLREYEALCALEVPGADIVYENDGFLVLNKPFGILSQKATSSDISVNEIARVYLINEGKLGLEEYSAYHPSVVNRLDRNTGGLIIVAKSRRAAVELTEDIRAKRLRRIYTCLMWGKLSSGGVFEYYYKKDEAKNLAILSEEPLKGYSRIKTEFRPVRTGAGLSLCEAELFTGKSHQIRVTGKAIGHPLVNDEKYGDPDRDFSIKDKISLPGQYLCATRLIFPDGMQVEIPVPKEFLRLLEEN